MDGSLFGDRATGRDQAPLVDLCTRRRRVQSLMVCLPFCVPLVIWLLSRVLGGPA